MESNRKSICCGTDLRLKCGIIGYLNLLACVVDIGCHVVILSIITNGFQCDISFDSLRDVEWPWLEPILLIVNIGTHGFYPFPMILRYHDSVAVPIDFLEAGLEPKCYPGMLHVHLVDVLDLTINVIYLKFVISYLVAVYKRDKDNIQMFFGLSMVKLFLQMMYFAYQPGLHSSFLLEGYWMIRMADILIASIFLIIMHKYIKQLKIEKMSRSGLPTYIESLIKDGPYKLPTGMHKSNAIVMPEYQHKEEKIVEKRIEF